MVIDFETTVFASKFGSLDGVSKPAPLRIFQNWLEFTCQPILLTVLVYVLDALKGLLAILDKFTQKPSSFKY